MEALSSQQARAHTNRDPAEHALDRQPTPSLRARRRPSSSSVKTASLSVDTAARPLKKRSPNYIRSQAASPEVISSLIDQLSAISASTQHHFESLSPRHHFDSQPAQHRFESQPAQHRFESQPAQHRFESPPAASPSPHVSRGSKTSVAGHHGSADDRPPYHSASREHDDRPPYHSASREHDDRPPYHSAIREHNDHYPDDACEPPVIRTSKPPSGLSPITAPPKTRKDKAHSLTSYLGRSAGSSASIHSCHSNRSSTSFGNISIEAAPIASKPVAAGGGGSNRSSAESKRSVKRPKGLMYMSSRERLKQKETDSRKRLDDAASPASQLFSYEDTINEEPLARDEHDPPLLAAPSTLARPGPSRNPSPSRRLRMNLVDGPQGDSSLEQALIPDRGSSLRHASPTKKSKRSASSKSRHKGNDAHALTSPELPATPKTPALTCPEQRSTPTIPQQRPTPTIPQQRPTPTMPQQRPTPNMDPDEERKQTLLLELEQEENEVAQRIKQLREQKLLRDKIAGKLPADSPAGTSAVAAKPHVSGLPSPEDSPASVVSPTPAERGLDCTKAHKLLGISTPPIARLSADSTLNRPREPTRPAPLPGIEPREPTRPAPLPGIEPREPTRPAPLPPHLRHSRHRSLTVNDGDDLPLPINYALALKTLDTSAPNSPQTPRVDSTHMTLSPPPSFSVASTQSATSNQDGLKRSSSLSVGGRSALARKANSMVMSGSKGHKHSSSLTEGTSSLTKGTSASTDRTSSLTDRTSSLTDRTSSLTEGKPLNFRSASEEISSGRYSSLSMASASNSFTLQQRKTLKKKRWSHPDLPAKAEKAHNDRVDAAEAAEAEARRSQYPVNPWSPVIEERPSSLDSIDMDVDAYLHAPRLSQKIRHPQTGRIISFSEVGDPNGFAVFVCVGMGLTRFVMAFYDQLAATLKLRLITPERPGIGGSQVDPNGTPLTWPDDVLIICQALKITKFSLLAHSAGAVYALATSLRMPQHVRGRVHLLAPWIPPSQMAPIGIGRDSPPTQQLPRSQRFLRALPPSLLRVANSTFLSNTSASLQRTGPAKAPKPRRKGTAPQTAPRNEIPPPRPSLRDNRRESMLMMDQVLPNASTLTLTVSHTHDPAAEKARLEALSMAERERQRAFDERLTFAIWDRATAGANPATDLIVCLETKQTIGFRYEDINRPVVIHHGSKDSRVPVDNVRWLGKLMRKCEVRVLDGEQHGLMASAQVMGNVLTEMASDWEDWTAVVKQASVSDLRGLARRKPSYA